MRLGIISAAVFLLNFPFGYWRANVRRFSLQWYLSIHLPVPAVIAMRLLSGVGWHLITFPLFIGSFFVGQFLGGRYHGLRSGREDTSVSSCLVMDLFGGAGRHPGRIP
jgi:hypothetical protein